VFFSPLLISKLRADSDLDKPTEEADGGKYKISNLTSYLIGSYGDLFGSVEVFILRRLKRRLKLIII
jgi:hypothetical protein